MKDGGIYVKSLAEHGAAELDERIHVGKHRGVTITYYTYVSVRCFVFRIKK